MSKNTIKSILNKFKSGQKISCITCYGSNFAKIIDQIVDIILVGDSVAGVVYGKKSTVDVTLQTMINHTKAVCDSTEKSLIVCDMPFGTYEKNKESAFESARLTFAESGCSAIKMEGGKFLAETVHFLTNRGMPVMGHVGVMPQRHNVTGYGKCNDSALVLNDIKSLVQAGAFAIVVENCGPGVLSSSEVVNLPVPLINIGSVGSADGTIAVIDDVLGITQNPPPFAKKYANLSEEIQKAVSLYVNDVSK